MNDYLITDDLGNEAEAEDIAAARVAAKTLVTDGAAEAYILRWDVRSSQYVTTNECVKLDRYNNPILLLPMGR